MRAALPALLALSLGPSASATPLLARRAVVPVQEPSGAKPAEPVTEEKAPAPGRTTSIAPSELDFDGRTKGWDPAGLLPVDEAGDFNRGYTLGAESARVAAPGRFVGSVHFTAANHLLVRENGGLLTEQRYERHGLAASAARGVKWGPARLELGVRLQAHESDGGFLNGFIAAFERGVAKLTGVRNAVNPLRNGETPPAPGYRVSRDGRVLHEEPGFGGGLGDATFTAKLALLDRSAPGRAARVAARAVLNAGQGRFSAGEYVGGGLGATFQLGGRVALHGDARAARALDARDEAGFPLRRGTAGASAAVELRATKTGSFTAQYDLASSPYRATGHTAFDATYAAATLGFNQALRAGGRSLLLQIYGREDMMAPATPRATLDPDFAVGVKLTIR